MSRDSERRFELRQLSRRRDAVTHRVELLSRSSTIGEQELAREQRDNVEKSSCRYFRIFVSLPYVLMYEQFYFVGKRGRNVTVQL